MDFRKLAEDLNIKELFAYGHAGSHLYGLNTPESDMDLALITSGKGRDKQRILGDLDFRIYPIDQMLKRLWSTAIPETDLIFSRTLTFNDNRYDSLLNGFRLNSNSYFKNSDTLALTHMSRINATILEDRRQYKALKASTRSIMLAWKAIDQGARFNPIFTESEKAFYWMTMENLTTRAQNGDDWKSLYDDLHLSTKKFREM